MEESNYYIKFQVLNNSEGFFSVCYKNRIDLLGMLGEIIYHLREMNISENSIYLVVESVFDEDMEDEV